MSAAADPQATCRYRCPFRGIACPGEHLWALVIISPGAEDVLVQQWWEYNAGTIRRI